MSDTSTGPWGPWNDHIGDGLAHCADYLGRLQRSLAAEIAPDRHYFVTKARALCDASVGLVGRARDVERWLGACGASYETEGGGDSVGSCGLAAGHAGEHDEGPTPAERLGERADALGAVATEVADTLAWATLAVDAGDDSAEVADALGPPPADSGSCAAVPGSWPPRWPPSVPAAPPDHHRHVAGQAVPLPSDPALVPFAAAAALGHWWPCW